MEENYSVKVGLGPSRISPSFDELFATPGEVPMYYYLVRHYPSPISCEIGEGPFDLHALSTPPAFILS